MLSPDVTAAAVTIGSLAFGFCCSTRVPGFGLREPGMNKLVLITGGAGFIGSHLADELLAAGARVRVLDNLSPQVHGEFASRPAYLDREVELLIGDVRDVAAVHKALEGVDAVFHLAAAVGVGQSMYQIAHYTSVNNLGTAVLLNALIDRPVERLIVASSMSIYGEGAYMGSAGPVLDVADRQRSRLAQGDWAVRDQSGEELTPMPTPEDKRIHASSVYALGKYDQERLCLLAGEAYGIPTVGLRFFNVYGPRQALSNPYTGVLAIFASRLLNAENPLIYEDGQQCRDFVNVRDVACACRLALEATDVTGDVLNIGSGRPITICEVASQLARTIGRDDIEPNISGRYRIGDIRHCFADISKAQGMLGFCPRVSFEEGLLELAEWLDGQMVVAENGRANQELCQRGLVV
jgi:dTDP-L-rhamnose 4-epimerase